jgi:FHA domain
MARLAPERLALPRVWLPVRGVQNRQTEPEISESDRRWALLAVAEDEMAILTCPNCAVRVQPEDLICFRCGANLPRAESPDDDLPTPTVSQKYISGTDDQSVCPNCGAWVPDPADLVCLECQEPLPRTGRHISPVVLRIAFPTGNVEVPAGTSLLLGRDPAQSLVAAAFARFDNVSRRHATVTVDDSGHAAIRDEGSTNGTFVNDERMLPGVEIRLVDGDQVRLGADVTGEVYLPRQELDPASLSRNDIV